MARFMVLDSKDNVAVAMEAVIKGATCFLSQGGEITVRADIPFAHKVAIKRITKDEKIYKYGQIIGQARQDIEPGDYVHIHNIRSFRNQVN
jgi:hypothetical protein